MDPIYTMRFVCGSTTVATVCPSDDHHHFALSNYVRGHDGD